jgi:hypothetical protein
MIMTKNMILYHAPPFGEQHELMKMLFALPGIYAPSLLYYSVRSDSHTPELGCQDVGTHALSFY